MPRRAPLLRAVAIPFSLMLPAACGSGIQAGAYANGGVVLEFGGEPGDPGYQHAVNGKRISQTCSGGGTAIDERAVGTSLERKDGREFVLRAS